MKDEILKILDTEERQNEVIQYASYCQRLSTEKKKDGTLKNPFMKFKKAPELADIFLRVRSQGLVFDGKHITLQSTGISYDYIAYKNKMLLVYPNSSLDVSVVYDGDEFDFSKDSGKVIYTHKISNPFENIESKIIGAYCVIKNSRGEFITTLSKAEIEKHKSVAKTQYIWNKWYKEMTMKTIIKKAVKYHFDDIYVEIEKDDNEQYDLEQAGLPEDKIDELQKVREDLEKLTTKKEVTEYYKSNKGKGSKIVEIIIARGKELAEHEIS